MRVQLKPLHQQVVVITGATSGIGLTTAKLAAERGAAVVLAARSEEALRRITEEIQQHGGAAAYAVADVGSAEDVRQIAQTAIDRFGRIDTWINNAMVSIFGRLTETPLEEHRRLFETNYWGIVNGSCVALEHLRTDGGALINIGSALSDRAVPFQGAYCASKFAIKGFTEALRMEVEEEGLPVSVTLIKPSSIDTPYYRVARNHLAESPKNPPPVYDPLVAAEAILYCAQHPRRDVYVGAGGPVFALANILAPRLTDRLMQRTMYRQQTMSGRSGRRSQDNLFQPLGDGAQRGGHPNRVRKSSLTTQMSLHPVASGLIILGAAALTAKFLRNKRRRTGRYVVTRQPRHDYRPEESIPDASPAADAPPVEQPAASDPIPFH